MAVRLQRAARAKVAPEIEREILRLAIEQPAFVITVTVHSTDARVGTGGKARSLSALSP